MQVTFTNKMIATIVGVFQKQRVGGRNGFILVEQYCHQKKNIKETPMTRRRKIKERRKAFYVD